jgi:hypothetical protein
MAVKVMLAPALLAREEERKARPAAEAKPKRRRSSVYDADGNEVFITLLCLKCEKMRPLSLFGLRRMADGAIRNQPWCRSCRAEASAANPKRRRAAGEAVAEPGEAGDAVAAPEQPLDPGRLAAQVVAALHNGRR